VTDLTSDRIPLRDIPINHQLQARLAQADVRIAELHTAVTRAEVERDRACASRDGMRSSLSRLGAEVVKLNEEADTLTVQRMTETRYQSRRVWIYRRNEWSPPWYQRFGFPFRGGDEWGRRTVVVGFWRVGYVCWAWRTCWCQDCHSAREQTYRLATTSPTGDPN
jgi:hypothetical protein